MSELVRFIRSEWVNILVFLLYLVTLFGSEFLCQRFEHKKNQRPENSAKENNK